MMPMAELLKGDVASGDMEPGDEAKLRVLEEIQRLMDELDAGKLDKKPPPEEEATEPVDNAEEAAAEGDSDEAKLKALAKE